MSLSYRVDQFYEDYIYRPLETPIKKKTNSIVEHLRMKLHVALGICALFVLFVIHLSPAEASPLSQDESRFMAEMMNEVSDDLERSPRAWMLPAWSVAKWIRKKYKKHRNRYRG
ncbi:uncharacterized protein LOC120352709 [Nilaparvata lugens]|uniref:uncharacterized protein LOC120352709 n=1 Tax=Nilaparvata lugens TaxID=108931 RepID=UPI00193C9551|nr:uncharacterized protein LOC120352709 [Nilaparvata lugens]